MTLRLNKKHGLNPTVPTCFICGESKNEVVLLGASYKDEAPMNMCLDKEPCDKCKDYMEKGVIFISVRDGESGDNPYRTGKFCVIKKNSEFLDVIKKDALKKGIVFVEDSMWKKLGLPVKNIEENKDV